MNLRRQDLIHDRRLLCALNLEPLPASRTQSSRYPLTLGAIEILLTAFITSHTVHIRGRQTVLWQRPEEGCETRIRIEVGSLVLRMFQATILPWPALRAGAVNLVKLCQTRSNLVKAHNVSTAQTAQTGSAAEANGI